MGYRSKNGWPATIREIVLEAVSNALDLALEEPYDEEFEGFFEVVEAGKKKIYLRTADGKNFMGFYCLGPDSEGFYEISTRVRGRLYESLFVYPKDSHSRSHAEIALCDIVLEVLVSFLDGESTFLSWEFEDLTYPESNDGCVSEQRRAGIKGKNRQVSCRGKVRSEEA